MNYSFRFYDLKNKEYIDLNNKNKNKINIIIDNIEIKLEVNKEILTEQSLSKLYDDRHVYQNDLIIYNDHLFICTKTKSGYCQMKAANYGAGSVTFSMPDKCNKGTKLIGSIWNNLDKLNSLPKSEQKRIKELLNEIHG